MQTAYATPSVRVGPQSASELVADVLVVPVFEDDDFADAPDLDAATGGELASARSRGQFRGKAHEVLVAPASMSGWTIGCVVLVGAGQQKDFTADRLRRACIAGGLTARQRRDGRLAVLFRPTTSVPVLRGAQVMAEGVCLANFDGGSYKTGDPPRVWIESVELCLPEPPPDVATAIDRGLICGEYTNRARAMANAPGNQLTPRIFAEQAREVAEAAGVAVEILDERRMAELRMGLLLGVARGSSEPPRLTVLRYEPANAFPGVVLGLVGKGITFDTGGISIKPAENMDKMKDDMSGGAAVVCAVAALARLQAPVRCIGVVPMTENMPGGRAIKPGDVLTSAEGKTVEILNTDAEGRLVLGDALWHARQLGATHLVDIATLTGACVVALGKTTTGLFGTPDDWVERVRRASDTAGDRSWPLPVFDDYKELFKSEIADFTNTGGRGAGAITGALFIKEFSGGLPWVHMDIAGTAWAEEPKSYQPKGATGVGVRTLIQLGLDVHEWGKLTPER